MSQKAAEEISGGGEVEGDPGGEGLGQKRTPDPVENSSGGEHQRRIGLKNNCCCPFWESIGCPANPRK